MRNLTALDIMTSLVAGMAGCGSESKADPVSDSGAVETESNDSSSKETVSSDSGSSTNDEKKKVVVFSKKREWEKGWNALADAYMKEHPDVEVVINLTDANNYYDELKQYPERPFPFGRIILFPLMIWEYWIKWIRIL